MPEFNAYEDITKVTENIKNNKQQIDWLKNHVIDLQGRLIRMKKEKQEEIKNRSIPRELLQNILRVGSAVVVTAIITHWMGKRK